MARKKKPAEPTIPPPALATRRQQLLALLEEGGTRGFDELRQALVVTGRALEDDLRHLERSLHRGVRRLVVTPARCRACGYVFRHRAEHHLHAPGKCPSCREERIEEPRFGLSAEPGG